MVAALRVIINLFFRMAVGRATLAPTNQLPAEKTDFFCLEDVVTDQVIKAIETNYKGCRFRSRLEARWAVFFDALGVEWQYEKEGFEFEDGTRYLPDFWIPSHNMWVEVKGSLKNMPKNEMEKIVKLYRKEKEIGHELVIVSEIPYGKGVELDNFLWNGSYFVMDTDIEENQKMFLRIFSDPYGAVEVGGGIPTICPVCGDLEAQLVDTISDRKYVPWAEGVSISIPMKCSAGHTWQLRFGATGNYCFAKIEHIGWETHDFALFLAGNMARRDEALGKARSARFEFGREG